MLKKALIASAMLASVAAAQAAGSAGWTVTGSINPGSCDIALTGGGVADMGTKSISEVQTYGTGTSNTGNTAYFYPTPAVLGVSVICPQATAFALNWADNRAASLWQYGSGTNTAGGSFSLGAHNGQPIGLYTIVYGNLTVTNGGTLGAFSKALTRPAVGSAWSTYTEAVLPGGVDIALTNSAAATAPTALTAMGGTIALWARVNRSVVDSANTAIVLDGSGTVSIVYI